MQKFEDLKNQFEGEQERLKSEFKAEKRTRLKKVLSVVLILISFTITFLSDKVPAIPTWNEVYSFFGLGDDGADSGFLKKLDFEPMPLTFTALDVGQGECLFICDKAGTSVLIDTGEAGNADLILNYIKLFGVKQLDYLIVTHPHTDHMGSAVEVLEKSEKSIGGVNNIIMPKLTSFNEPKTDFYKEFKYAAESSGASVLYASAGEVLEIGDMRLTFLGPLTQSENLNNMSLVIRLEYGETSFLLMGDAESEEEIQILKTYPAEALDADVIVVGHHGSDSSSTYEFIAAVSPENAVISCGKDNYYGHPHQATLNTLDLLSASVYRTDENGDIAIGSDGKKITVLR